MSFISRCVISKGIVGLPPRTIQGPLRVFANVSMIACGFPIAKQIVEPEKTEVRHASTAFGVSLVDLFARPLAAGEAKCGLENDPERIRAMKWSHRCCFLLPVIFAAGSAYAQSKPVDTIRVRIEGLAKELEILVKKSQKKRLA